jgi:hypothetical protein
MFCSNLDNDSFDASHLAESSSILTRCLALATH